MPPKKVRMMRVVEKPRLLPLIIQHIDHNRYIHTPDHQRMCFGKHFQVRIFEKLCLPFIMNFFELHTLFLEAAKIRNVKGE